MLKDTKGPTLLRITRALRAALNLAARHDKRVTNHDAWRDGLRLVGIAETFKARNVILKDHEVARIVEEAYGLDPAFGLYVEVHAVTGARSSQIARLDIGDLQDDRPDPRLMMPPSRKGAKRDHTPKPVPITADLARKLRMAGGRRARTAPLLVRADGERWRPEVDDHLKPFAAAAQRAGIDATMYALRHSSIVRSILRGVPIRVVAVAHDTSVNMIERTYSAHSGDHSDAVMRAGLLDLTPSDSNNVVALPPRRS
jgi:integrase